MTDDFADQFSDMVKTHAHHVEKTWLEITEGNEWFHGGPYITGNQILPPTVTGLKSATDYLLEEEPDLDASHVRDDMVFLINDERAAMIFACVHDTPTVYRCVPLLHETTLDPDYLTQGERGIYAVQTPSARILQRQRIPNSVARKFRTMLLAGMKDGA